MLNDKEQNNQEACEQDVNNQTVADNTNGESQSVDDEATTQNTDNEQDINSTEGAQDAAEEQDPLVVAQAQIKELQEQLLYKRAEFENYRKNVIREKAELLLNGAEKTVLAMLPVVDDFERAMANISKAEDVDALRKGIELIQQKFIKALEGMGVKSIDTTNAVFSTDHHEAIAQIPAPSDDMKGKVIDCVQTGYTLNDKVIRYAKVVVGV